MNKWLQFSKERFEPFSHITMIALFLGGHILFAYSLGIVILKHWQFVPLSLAVLCFFIKLRFYDEIKDYETDMRINPTRPLPRGLVTHQDLHKGITTAIFVEAICFALCSPAGLIAGFLAIVYSLLMFKEFFIGSYIRPHLTTYAMSHTVVTILLSLSIFSSLSGLMIYNLPSDIIWFSTVSWLLFNIFEFGRKSYLLNEEREGVPTYSNIFGRWGAFALVLSQALLATYLMLQIEIWNNPSFRLVLISILFLLTFFGLIYGTAKTNSNWGKIYRAFTSIYIVLIYGAVIVYFLI